MKRSSGSHPLDLQRLFLLPGYLSSWSVAYQGFLGLRVSKFGHWAPSYELNNLDGKEVIALIRYFRRLIKKLIQDLSGTSG
jgi:hypothetical protein